MHYVSIVTYISHIDCPNCRYLMENRSAYILVNFFDLHVGVEMVQLRSAGFGLHPFLVHTALILPSRMRCWLQL